MGGLVQLLVAVHRLHGQEAAPHLHKGQAQLAEKPQIGHGPGGDQVEGVPHGLLQGLFLRPALNSPDAGQSQLGGDLIQPVHPLVQAVQQGHIQLGQQNLQGQAGKARPGAHVQQGAGAGQVGAGEQGGAVQHVQPGHPRLIPDGGEVHHLVFFQQQAAIFR